jgi:tRNA(fMet)-specific endonuclease VapC
MRYLLDTNICGYIIRERPIGLRSKLHEMDTGHELALSSVVVAELLYGAKKKNSAKFTKTVHAFIENFTLYDFDKEAARACAEIRTALEQKGQIIGSNDLLIAAHARALGAVLVTNNLKEFQRVEGLRLDNWAASL